MKISLYVRFIVMVIAAVGIGWSMGACGSGQIDFGGQNIIDVELPEEGGQTPTFEYVPIEITHSVPDDDSSIVFEFPCEEWEEQVREYSTRVIDLTTGFDIPTDDEWREFLEGGQRICQIKVIPREGRWPMCLPIDGAEAELRVGLVGPEGQMVDISATPTASKIDISGISPDGFLTLRQRFTPTCPTSQVFDDVLLPWRGLMIDDDVGRLFVMFDGDLGGTFLHGFEAFGVTDPDLLSLLMRLHTSDIKLVGRDIIQGSVIALLSPESKDCELDGSTCFQIKHYDAATGKLLKDNYYGVDGMNKFYFIPDAVVYDGSLYVMGAYGVGDEPLYYITRIDLATGASQNFSVGPIDTKYKIRSMALDESDSSLVLAADVKAGADYEAVALFRITIDGGGISLIGPFGENDDYVRVDDLKVVDGQIVMLLNGFEMDGAGLPVPAEFMVFADRNGSVLRSVLLADEFSGVKMAYDMGKVFYVLKGTDVISGDPMSIVGAVRLDTGASVFKKVAYDWSMLDLAVSKKNRTLFMIGLKDMGGFDRYGILGVDFTGWTANAGVFEPYLGGGPVVAGP